MIYYITFFVILITVVILEVMIKKRKIARNSKVYMIVNLVGVLIPIILMIIHYFYFQTDTVLDWILTSILSMLVIGILYLANKYYDKSDKYYFFVPIELCLFAVIYIIILQHTLNYISETFLFGLCGSVLGTSIKRIKRNKIAKIIVSTLVIVILLFIFNSDIIDSKKQIKPIRKVIEYVKINGYKSYPNDFYYIGSNNNRYTPIRITLYTIPREKRITDELEFEYYEGQVIEVLKN